MTIQMKYRIANQLDKVMAEGLTHSALKSRLGPGTLKSEFREGVIELVESGLAVWGTYFDTEEYAAWWWNRQQEGLVRASDRSNGPRGARPAYILWTPQAAPEWVQRRARLDRDGVEGEPGFGCSCWDYIDAAHPDGRDQHCPSHGEQDAHCAECLDNEHAREGRGLRLPPFPS